MTATLPDHTPFYSVIRDRPDDDAPRLRFADWLQEHGDEERAEFIRVQCELARLESIRIVNKEGEVCGWKRKKDRDRHYALRRRERELLGEHGKEWARPVAEALGLERWGNAGVTCGPNDPRFGCGWQFARGFIDSVSLTTRQLIGGQCERCQGQVGRCPHCDGRSVLRVDMSNPGMWCERCWAVTKRSCSDCAGTGTLPGLAAALGQSCPLLTRVVLTDREPGDFFPSTWTWWRESTSRDSETPDNATDLIPDELWYLIDLKPNRSYPSAKDSPTRALALSALATAAARFCREAGGD